MWLYISDCVYLCASVYIRACVCVYIYSYFCVCMYVRIYKAVSMRARCIRTCVWERIVEWLSACRWLDLFVYCSENRCGLAPVPFLQLTPQCWRMTSQWGSRVQQYSGCCGVGKVEKNNSTTATPACLSLCASLVIWLDHTDSCVKIPTSWFDDVSD